MTQTVLGGSWYRIADSKPRLRAHAQIHRQRYRGETWYVIQDHQSGMFFRISPAANFVLSLMDGRRSMQTILDLAGKRFGAERPTQDEVVQLLIKLHNADLLHAETLPDMAEVGRRADRHSQQHLLAWLRSPLAMRFPLLDPDRFLDYTMPVLRPLFTSTGFMLWLALVVSAAVLAAMHWPELSANVSDRVFATQNVVILALTYPVIKAFHELGHAYATKAGGGEVHELGCMMLVFLPVPYVDASSSSAFREPWRRALVGGAGIMVELALASLALIAWLHLAPGLLRAIAFNVMLIGSVSTLVFNGNPLLRFDGYYVLADFLQIANLDARSKRYLLYVIQRYPLGLEKAESPVHLPGERSWFVIYGIASFIYRVVVMVGVALFIAGKFAFVGALLALWTATQMFLYPMLRAVRYLATNPQLKASRGRVFAMTGGAAAVVIVLLFGLPLPYAAVVEGVVWVPDEAVLRSGGEGFVQRLLVNPGDEVSAGQPVIALEDPTAAAQVEVRRAELAVLRNRFTAVDLIDRVQTDLVREQIVDAEGKLERAQQHVRDLLVCATRAGRFVVPDARKLVGRFVKQGDLLGYVIARIDPDIRAVVPQADIDLVRQRTRAVAVRFTDRIETSVTAQVLRETPAALDKAPAPSLTSEGGGPILLDPSSPNHDRPLERFYQIELAVPDSNEFDRIGDRVFVRFDFGAEAIAWRILRGTRQLLLRALNV